MAYDVLTRTNVEGRLNLHIFFAPVIQEPAPTPRLSLLDLRVPAFLCLPEGIRNPTRDRKVKEIWAMAGNSSAATRINVNV